jgi:Type II secretion system (T2SS), protein E, N-terminal domain
MPEAGVADVEQYRHRVPLGLILLAKGWITQPQLRHALDAQQRAGAHPVGQWLIEECGIPQLHIARALGMQWGCPVLTMEGFDPEAMALAMPRLLMEACGIVPIRIARDRVLYLGCVDQPDPAAALAIERMSGLKVVSGLIGSAQQSSAQQSLTACANVDAAFEHAPDFESLSRRIASTIVAAQPRASRLVRVHQFFWLRMWLEAGAMSTPSGGFPRTREDVADRIFTFGSEQ